MYINNHVKSSCLSINGPCSSMFLNFVNRVFLISFQDPGLASRLFIREPIGRGHWQLQGFNATADPLTPGFDVRGPAWFLAFFQCASKKHILFRSEKWKTGWGLKFYFESWSWLKFIKSPGARGVNPSKRESIRIISPCRMETEKISFRQPETNDRCILGHAFFLWHGLTIGQLSDCWKMLPKKNSGEDWEHGMQHFTSCHHHLAQNRWVSCLTNFDYASTKPLISMVRIYHIGKNLPFSHIHQRWPGSFFEEALSTDFTQELELPQLLVTQDVCHVVPIHHVVTLW